VVAPTINTSAENANRQKELEIAGKLPTPWVDAGAALVEKSFQQTPLGDIFGRAGLRTAGDTDNRGFIERYFDLQDLRNNGEEKLSAHELNEIYPNVEEQFRDGETRAAAKEIARRSYERQTLDSRIQRGNLGTASSLGLSALAFMSDPLSAAVSFLPPIRAIGAMTAAKFGGQVGLTGRIAGGVAEATAVNAIEEAAFYASSRSELADVTAADSLRNIAFGAAGLGALHFGASSVIRGVKSLPGLSKHLLNNSISSILTGKKPNVDAITRAATQEISGAAGNVGHRFAKLAPEEVSTRPFYHGSSSVRQSLDSVPVGKRSNDFVNLGDEGISFSDHPLIENGKAANSTVDQQGLVREIRLSKSLNLIDLDQTVDTRVLAAAKSQIEQMQKAMPKGDFDKMVRGTGRGIYEEADKLIRQEKIPADSINKMNKALDAAGFDGARTEVGGRFNGANVERHNTVKLFGETAKKYSEQRSFTANKELTQGLDNEQLSNGIKDNFSEANDMAIDIKEVRQNQILSSEFEKDIAVKQEEITRNVAELEAMKKRGLLDAEDLAELEETKALKKKIDEEQIITRNAIICLNRQ